MLRCCYNRNRGYNITDKGFEYIALSIKALGPLKRLALGFAKLFKMLSFGSLIINSCPGITGQSFKYLDLSNARELRDLTLNFRELAFL